MHYARRRPHRDLFLAVTAASLFAQPSQAVTTWQGTLGDWLDPANWTNSLPSASSLSFINNAGTAQITSGSAVSGNLRLGQADGQSGSLFISGGTLSASYEYIGAAGQGSVIQTGGTHSFTPSGVLYLGFSFGGTGSYILGSNSRLAVPFEEIVGYNGLGSFAQTDGVNATGGLHLGEQTGTGVYNLSGNGVLNAIHEYIGEGGLATFNQTGGNNTAKLGLTLGEDLPDIPPVYNLSGTASLTVSSGTEVITYGQFIQTGGTHSVGTRGNSGYLYLGKNSSGTASYLLNGANALLTVGESVYLGASDTASFDLQAGTMTVFNALKISSSGSATFNLSGGMLSVGTLDTSGSPSRFHWTGGALEITGQDLLVDANGPLGQSISSAFPLSVLGSETIGEYSNATFSQTGGTHTVGTPSFYPDSPPLSKLYLGAGLPGTTGVYTLSGASLLTAYADEYIGYTSAGVFTQSAGTHYNVGSLFIGHSAGSSGIYTLSGNALLTSRFEKIGEQGVGSFVQNGGTSSADFLIIGESSTGNYSLSGAASLTVTNYEYIGYGAPGTFSQTGGTNTVGGPVYALALSLGNYVGGIGEYDLSGTGSLVVTNLETVGINGSGIFNQSGGTHFINLLPTGPFFYLASGPGSTGVYNLSGSASLLIQGTALSSTGTHGSEYISYAGKGTFNQSAGTHDIAYSTLFLAYSPSGVGVYNLSDGLLTTNLSENVGVSGTALFNQTGGTNFNSGLSIATTSGSGTYTLNGANALCTVQGSLYVGGNSASHGGVGQLNILTGKMIVSKNLTIWDYPNNSVTLTGGLLSVDNLDTSGNPSRFIWTGGTLAITGTGGLTIGPSGPLGDNVLIDANKTLKISTTLVVTSGTSLSFADAGNVDITNQRLIVVSSSQNLDADFATYHNYVRDGQIHSSAITPYTTLALMKSSDYFALHADSEHPKPSFDGISVDPTDVLIKYTYFGDADFDGTITMNDYALLEAGFFFGNFNGTTNPAPWAHGDFNDDGLVNYLDYALIDNAFHLQSGTLANDLIQQHALQFGTPYTQYLASLQTVPVPEPASLALLLATVPMLLRRPGPTRSSPPVR